MFTNLSFVIFPALISKDIAIVKISIVCNTLLLVFGYEFVTVSNIFLKLFKACFKIRKFLVPLLLNVEVISAVFSLRNLIKSALFSYLIRRPFII